MKRILCVDDDKRNREVLGRFLEFLGVTKDHIVLCADGQYAIEQLGEADHGIVCVITDCNMPRKNGFDVLRFAIGQNVRQGIMISGRGDMLTNAQVLFGDIIRLQTLLKPLTLAEFDSALRAVLPQSTGLMNSQ